MSLSQEVQVWGSEGGEGGSQQAIPRILDRPLSLSSSSRFDSMLEVVEEESLAT